MNHRKSYKIVHVRAWENGDDLEKTVCSYMNKGWLPIGGPFYQKRDGYNQLSQAMIFNGLPETKKTR